MRVLEFTLATTIILLFETSFAYFVGTTIGARIKELFEIILLVFP